MTYLVIPSGFLPTKSPSPILRYVTSIASRGITYKLKPKVILVYHEKEWISLHSIRLQKS